MKFIFNNKKFKKDIIREILTMVFCMFVTYLFFYFRDSLELLVYPLSICLISAFIGYLFIYPILAMFNYRKFNKDSTISIDKDKIVYKYLGNEEVIIKIEDINTIYAIKGHGSTLFPYYYEIKLKDGRIFYISYFLIKDLEEYVNNTIYWRRGSLFIPKK